MSDGAAPDGAGAGDGGGGPHAAEPAVSFRDVGRSAAILTGAAGAMQALGVVREVFVAAQVGLSAEYDALLVVLSLPATLAGVFTAGTVTAMVPAYLEARDRRGREDARRLAGMITVWVGIAGLALWLVLEVLGAAVIELAGPGLSAASRDAATGYLQLLAPLAFVSAVSGVIYGICQAEERFAAIAFSGLTGSAVTLATLLVLWQPMGLGALALGNLAGPIVTALVLLVSAARGSVMPRPTPWTNRTEITSFVRHAAPLVVSSAVLQINGIADRAIASLITPGAVSALRYADVLVRTPIGAISPAWGTALYPSLVRVALGSAAALSSATERSIRYVLSLFVPVAVLTVAVAPVAVAVGYGRGAFSPDDVIRTAQAVAAFAPLIVVMMCYPPLTGALNAQHRGGVLLAAGVMNVCLNFALDVAFGLWLGAPGVALSSSLTAIVVLVFFSWRLSRSEDSINLMRVARTLLVATIASLPFAIPIGLLSWFGVQTPGLVIGLLLLVVFGILGIAGYLVVATRLRLDEARALRQVVTEWGQRRRHVAGPSR